MTPKQQKFADEYIKSSNATKAALKAGYSEKTAYSLGNENLKKPEVKKYINAQLEKLHKSTIADADEVLQYLTSVMRGKETESVTTSKGVFNNVPVGAKDRIKAAELVGKRYGTFTDKLETTNTNIEINVGDDYDG